MNKYLREIKAWQADTARLSLIEVGAYTRLVDEYYDSEIPLPADISELNKIAMARTASEKKAVVTVLKNYFNLSEDGYVQNRCEEEIYAFRSGDRKHRNKNSERVRKHRRGRSMMLSELRESGIPIGNNIKTNELRDVYLMHSKEDVTLHVTDCNEPVTESNGQCNTHVMGLSIKSKDKDLNIYSSVCVEGIKESEATEPTHRNHSGIQTPITENWTPSPETVTWVTEARKLDNCTASDVAWSADKFRLHNRGKKSSSWDLDFRKWALGEFRFPSSSKSGGLAQTSEHQEPRKMSEVQKALIRHANQQHNQRVIDMGCREMVVPEDYGIEEIL